MPHPVIIYVPGLLPKPDPEAHRHALRRCLLEGIRRIDPAVAQAIEATSGGFEILPWTFDFYHEHRNIELDRSAIEALLQQPEASPKDIAEAYSWSRRLTRWIYQLGDMLPFLIPHFASERMEVHLRDLRRYHRNKNDIAEQIRQKLKVVLLAAASAQQPILLIGHSMGSIISYDTLWELSQESNESPKIDLLLTMGSPLGQRFMQKIIKGHSRQGRDRYPGNIRRWKNLAAVGDLTAIDPALADNFAEMVTLGVVQLIEDEELLNSFRLNGVLNVHSEYGYLINEKTALTVADWWRGHDSNRR